LRRFENAGVVGAGMMGSEIALMFALVCHPTKLSDQERGLADKALRSPAWSRERGVGRGLWNAEAAESARRNLSAANGLDDHGDGNLVIEAVFERIELKRGSFSASAQ
jgi:3-hydroxybutyryl-CoA dehydrogenase